MTTLLSTERSRALQAAATCLDYPDDHWRAVLPVLDEVTGTLSKGAAPLQRFLDHATGSDAATMTRHYVETFDLRRRCSLYLTYYAHGDTRKRGMALLEFSSTYRQVGEELTSGELPDHLAVVCEFAARHPEEGLRLMQSHRAGIELLGLALEDEGSPYLHVVDLVRAALPEAAPRDLEAALALARSGPPAEEVGLEPFAPPEPRGARR